MKDFWQHELDELKQNKIRVIALGCLVVLLIFLAIDDSSGDEEIILDDEPPLTKDLPVKVLPVEKSSDGVTLVLGADADELIIGDPFAGEDEPKPPPEPVVEPVPLIVLEPPPEPIEQPKQPKERIILTGTAISGEIKTAMFLRDKETLFLTVGEEIGGKIISDISAEFVTFEDGQKVYLQKELR